MSLWTMAEISTLRRLAGTMSTAAIGAQLGRSPRAVQSAAARHGICLRRYGEHNATAKYRDADVEAIRLLYDAGVRPKEIATRFPHVHPRSIDRFVYYTLRLGPEER